MRSGAVKPTWVVDKERAKRQAANETVWLFGLHAVRDALLNPDRQKLRLVLTKNAADKLEDALAAGGIEPEIVEPRQFDVHPREKNIPVQVQPNDAMQCREKEDPVKHGSICARN